MKHSILFLILLFQLNPSCIIAQFRCHDFARNFRPFDACHRASVLPILEFPTLGSEIGLASIGVVTSKQNWGNFHQNPSNLTTGAAGIEILATEHPIFNQLDNTQMGIQSLAMRYKIDDIHGFGLAYKNLYIEKGGDVTSSSPLPEELRAQNERLFSLSYSQKIGQFIAIGIGWKYIKSDLKLINFVQEAKSINTNMFDLGIQTQQQWTINDSLDIGIKIGASFNNLGVAVSHFEEIKKQKPHPAAHFGGLFFINQKDNDQADFTANLFFQSDKLLSPHNIYYFGDADNNNIDDFQEIGFARALFYNKDTSSDTLQFDNWKKWVHHTGVELWFEGKNDFTIGFRSGIYFGKILERITLGTTLQYKNVFIHLARATQDLDFSVDNNYYSISLGLKKRFKNVHY